MAAALSSAHVSAETWDDVERLMHADEPINFLLEGETKAAFAWDKLPTAAEVVDILRQNHDNRILPGRVPKSAGGGGDGEPAFEVWVPVGQL